VATAKASAARAAPVNSDFEELIFLLSEARGGAAFPNYAGEAVWKCAAKPLAATL
jgi:hypothetical protein